MKKLVLASLVALLLPSAASALAYAPFGGGAAVHPRPADVQPNVSHSINATDTIAPPDSVGGSDAQYATSTATVTAATTEAAGVPNILLWLVLAAIVVAGGVFILRLSDPEAEESSK